MKQEKTTEKKNNGAELSPLSVFCNWSVITSKVVMEGKENKTTLKKKYVGRK